MSPVGKLLFFGFGFDGRAYFETERNRYSILDWTVKYSSTVADQSTGEDGGWGSLEKKARKLLGGFLVIFDAARCASQKFRTLNLEPRRIDRRPSPAREIQRSGSARPTATV